MRRFFCPLLLFALFTVVAQAQYAAPRGGVPGAAASDKQPLTLAAALAAVPPPKEDVTLTVGADRVLLPSAAEPPSPNADTEQVADAFARTTRRFGTIQAIAPPMMTVLNTDPGTPNIYDGMPTQDAFKLLAASLDQKQWAALTSPQGLGVSDLTSDDQRSLFLAQFPSGTIKAYPVQSILHAPDTPRPPVKSLDLSADLPQAHICLQQEVLMMLPSRLHEGTEYNIFSPDGEEPQRYHLEQGGPQQDTLYGVKIRAEVPNEPKDGPLDFDAPALHAVVPLDRLKTVGDLVTRVSSLCKIELYADPRYEGQTLTVLGAAHTAPAGDLLRAMAFCVTGTFRRVGPAYVLTDDQVGLDTRRALLSQFEKEADALRQKPLDAAGDALVTHHPPDEVPMTDDPVAFTPEQRRLAADTNMGDSLGYLQIPFSQLSPDQQALARKKLAQFQAAQPLYTWIKDGDTVTLDGKISLQSHPKITLLLPSLAQPVEIGDGPSLDSLFRPSDKLQNERMHARMAAEEKAAKPPPAPSPPVAPPSPTLQTLFQGCSKRAVLASPRTAAEVDALITSMKTIGLNELWLDVFSEGVCRFPGTPRSPMASKLPAGQDDILTEALRVTSGSGIAVYPVLDLLQWGADAPKDAQDLTVLGDNAAQADARQRRMDALKRGDDAGAFSENLSRVYVSPFAPAVSQTLAGVIHAVVAHPGIAGLVWRGTTPPGYGGRHNYSGNPEFGYAEAARLAFLRRFHADPIDLPVQWPDKADTTLPHFDDAAVRDLVLQWERFRQNADTALLGSLRAAWPTAAQPTTSLLIQQTSASWRGDWYGSWDGPPHPLPAYHERGESGTDGPDYPEEPAAQARSESRLAVQILPSWYAYGVDNLVGQLSQAHQGPPWDGFVLDLLSASSSDRNWENPLARLAVGMKPTGEK